MVAACALLQYSSLLPCPESRRRVNWQRVMCTLLPRQHNRRNIVFLRIRKSFITTLSRQFLSTSSSPQNQAHTSSPHFHPFPKTCKRTAEATTATAPQHRKHVGIFRSPPLCRYCVCVHSALLPLSLSLGKTLAVHCRHDPLSGKRGPLSIWIPPQWCGVIARLPLTQSPRVNSWKL